MKRLWLIICCTALLLSGCLDAEKCSLSLDLKNRTAELGYSNIVSDSKEEDKVRADFKEMLDMAFGDTGEKDEKSGRRISAKLYEQDGHLDGVTKYSFRNRSEMLKEYEIATDEKGDFVFDMTNEELEYLGGNGSYIEEAGKRFIRWKGNSASLDMTLRNKKFDPKNRGLLPYWLEWKEKNRK